MTCQRQRLHVYRDGEIRAWRRWWTERHLKRCSGCRTELASLWRLGDLVRASTKPTPGFDLWTSLQPHLAALQSERLAIPRTRFLERAARTLREDLFSWRVGMLAAAAGVAAILVWPAAPPARPGVVRSLDPKGSSVLVLSDAEEATTIIWLMDSHVAEPSYEAAGVLL